MAYAAVLLQLVLFLVAVAIDDVSMASAAVLLQQALWAVGQT